MLASAETLKRFDTDGTPIVMGKEKWTKRCASRKKYQTPYGEIERNVYQTSKGGRIYCPLEAAWIGRATPTLDAAVATVAISLDGAMLPMRESGWREAMVGHVSLYAPDGERLHSLYIAEAPEYGKATCKERLEREIGRVKAQYPEALHLGIADGVPSHWSFLEAHTKRQRLDYFHAAEYLPNLAMAAYPGKSDPPKRDAWRHERQHRLKPEPGAVDALIAEAEDLMRKTSLSKTVTANLRAALTYFTK
ncbi:hypothetical protein CKO27_13770 [Thiocystis violacea]|nr:hypothetical protein [Thiocystis violacea]